MAETGFGKLPAGGSRAWSILAMSVLITLAGAATARAGKYHVYSCRTPAGAPIPTHVAESGWSGSITGSYNDASYSCAEGGSLVAGLDANYAHPANESFARWDFSAPPGESIAATTLWRAGDAEGGVSPGVATYLFWLSGPNDYYEPGEVFDQCVPNEGCTGFVGTESEPLSKSNKVEVPPASLGSHLYINASCGGAGDSGAPCPDNSGDLQGFAAVVYMYAANFILEQDAPPTVSNVGGELSSTTTIDGSADLTFTATDSGSGVYEAIVEIDGRVVEDPVLDENGGHCRNVGETTDGLPAFLYPQPCPSSLNADVTVSTSGLSDGQHRLVVRVTDAAGNSAIVFDHEITVGSGGTAPSTTPSSPTAEAHASPAGSSPVTQPGAQPGAPNGTDASAQAMLTAHWTHTAKPALTASYGTSERVTGRLTTSAGQPIAGASIDAYETPSYASAHAQTLPSPHTGPSGEWSLTLPNGTPSSSLRFGYRSHLNDTTPAATTSLTLRVHAGIALGIAPHVTSVGRRIHFSGVVHGPIPPGGKQLVLEASSGGEWVKFDTVHTNAQGGYRASYRFKFPGPVTYRFRVVSPFEADFPFLAGISDDVAVREL